mgnify:CR=1 FL=1
MSWKKIIKSKLPANEVEGNLTHRCDVCKQKKSIAQINSTSDGTDICIDCQIKRGKEATATSNAEAEEQFRQY